jgi:hypothetical protein
MKFYPGLIGLLGVLVAVPVLAGILEFRLKYSLGADAL